MNIFSEVKEQLTTRQVAESYGLRILKNGVARCPFHDDRHPSMKVDKNYHCFACGVGGDVIDYTARMYGLSQYDAAKKLIEDFGLHVQTEAMSREERQRLRREKEERMRIIQIKKKFYRWCEETIELLKDALVQIEDSGQVLYGKPPDVMFSEDYAMMLHAEPIINYWLDILCMGKEQEKKELFMKGRKEVEHVVDCQHFFRQIFLGYFSDIVQAFDTLRKNVCGDDYTSLHNPIVLSSVLPAYGMFHSIQILFL